MLGEHLEACQTRGSCCYEVPRPPDATSPLASLLGFPPVTVPARVAAPQAWGGGGQDACVLLAR